MEQAGIRRPRHSPESLLGLWERFADKCIEGFQGSIEEYIDGIGVRSVLQHAVQSVELVEYPEVIDFTAALAAVDLSFRNCLELEARSEIARPSLAYERAWYWQYLPAYAGRRLSRDVAMHYGLEIPVRQRES
ncbi:hypothetical protein [Streptomyces sp. NPDC049881]|uniref:hypothetical protein n=1 Tax=Streptomyces sp. NPDC049881 TaxID=3155778 RepID=UPI003426FE7B